LSGSSRRLRQTAESSRNVTSKKLNHDISKNIAQCTAIRTASLTVSGWFSGAMWSYHYKWLPACGVSFQVFSQVTVFPKLREINFQQIKSHWLTGLAASLDCCFWQRGCI